jgi:hypothetical protein
MKDELLTRKVIFSMPRQCVVCPAVIQEGEQRSCIGTFKGQLLSFTTNFLDPFLPLMINFSRTETFGASSNKIEKFSQRAKAAA